MKKSRPAKPLSIVKGHRTTGIEMEPSEEVKNNAIAIEEFKRIKKLYASIQMDDGLFSNVINMYCMLLAECQNSEQMKKRIQKGLEDAKALHKSKEIDTPVYLQLKSRLNSQCKACNYFIATNRALLLSIAKESFLTVHLQKADQGGKV